MVQINRNGKNFQTIAPNIGQKLTKNRPKNRQRMGKIGNTYVLRSHMTELTVCRARNFPFLCALCQSLHRHIHWFLLCFCIFIIFSYFFMILVYYYFILFYILNCFIFFLYILFYMWFFLVLYYVLHCYIVLCYSILCHIVLFFFLILCLCYVLLYYVMNMLSLCL